MSDRARLLFSDWNSFYVMVGTGSAALIGLMFVAVTVIPRSRTPQATGRLLGVFATPTVVHFCSALLLAGIFSAPWRNFAWPGSLIAIAGAAGLAYACFVLRRARRQSDYQPVREDWVWHTVLPILAYTTLVVAGVLLPHCPRIAAFLTAGPAILFLFIGIHNAWDTVTYVSIQRAREDHGD